jgi:hypothetical protein
LLNLCVDQKTHLLPEGFLGLLPTRLEPPCVDRQGLGEGGPAFTIKRQSSVSPQIHGAFFPHITPDSCPRENQGVEYLKGQDKLSLKIKKIDDSPQFIGVNSWIWVIGPRALPNDGCGGETLDTVELVHP